MADLSTLAAVAVCWHKARFPNARMEHVALKLCEEAGEVARAVNGEAGMNSATSGGDVGAEAADVAIVLLVLLGRWFPDRVLTDEVERKLLILLDPNGGHPACALPVLP